GRAKSEPGPWNGGASPAWRLWRAALRPNRRSGCEFVSRRLAAACLFSFARGLSTRNAGYETNVIQPTPRAAMRCRETRRGLLAFHAARGSAAPSASKSTRKQFARSSPHRARKRQVLECPVL